MLNETMASFSTLSTFLILTEPSPETSYSIKY